jgi:hypothetical protein
MNIPNNLQLFLSLTSGYSYKISEPAQKSGNWWVDFNLVGEIIPVTYKESQGFGFYDLEDVDFGSFPVKIIDNYKEAAEYLFKNYFYAPQSNQNIPHQQAALVA